MVGVAGSRHARVVDLVDPTITDVDAEGPSGRRHQPRLITWLAAAIAAVGALLVVGDDIGGRRVRTGMPR